MAASNAVHHARDMGVGMVEPSPPARGGRRSSRTSQRVAVIGDGDFVHLVGGVASRRGHRIVCSSGAKPAGAVTPDSSMPEYDLLVIQAEHILRLGDVPHSGTTSARFIALTAADVRRRKARSLDNPLSAGGRLFKRCVDLAISLIALLLLWPVMLVAALLVRLDSAGGAIFRQTRLGANGRSFTCYKLRTMVADNDHSRHAEYVNALIEGRAVASRGMYKLTADPRITRVGRHLRRLSIDELPQLWNVLRGEMSIVGPRPPLPYEVALYDGTALQRLRVKPGLTGLWQVSGRCELSFADMVALDNEYWRRWSPMLDLRIILKTPGALLRGRGAS